MSKYKVNIPRLPSTRISTKSTITSTVIHTNTNETKKSTEEGTAYLLIQHTVLSPLHNKAMTSSYRHTSDCHISKQIYVQATYHCKQWQSIVFHATRKHDSSPANCTLATTHQSEYISSILHTSTTHWTAENRVWHSINKSANSSRTKGEPLNVALTSYKKCKL